MIAIAIGTWIAFALVKTGNRPYQNLHIPEAYSGTSFDLHLHKGRHSFWAGATTETYSYNKEPFWGPTLVMNRGDQVKIQVTNDLSEPTTVHWHGFHIPAKEDGGPHQMIPSGGVWISQFKVKNNAATYWYHPHPHEATQKQLTMGAGGLIIVRDPIESKLNLPRTYGVDDIPLVFTSRRFTKANEFSYQGDSDKYGDFEFCNGTLDPQVSLPAQWVRLRILNAEVERGYNLGFKDNQDFYLIATDGGLVDQPIKLKRLKLMVGERAEIMVNLAQRKVGSTLDLYSFNQNQPFGFPGGEPGYYSPNGSYLNNLDFPLLHINVGAPKLKHAGSLPDRLVSNHLWKEADAVVTRKLSINGGGPPEKEFQFGGQYFDMGRVDQLVKLGSVESWTVRNDQIFGHSFHIHDVQFTLVERNGHPVEEYEKGWKDTVYIPRAGSVKFVTKFEDFVSDRYPYMYHCHMSNHEDGGLMGQFLVVEDPSKLQKNAEGEVRLEHAIKAEQANQLNKLILKKAPQVMSNVIAFAKPTLLVFLEQDCPCSRELASYVGRIASAYGERVSVVGILDASQTKAKEWSRSVAAKFQVIADPSLKMAKAYGAKTSASMIIVQSGGVIDHSYPGYSTSWLNEISAKLGKFSGQKKGISFTDAPKTPRAGCVLVASR